MRPQSPVPSPGLLASTRAVIVPLRPSRINDGLPTLTGGSNIPTVLIHTDDASDLGVLDGADVTVSSATGSITLPATVRDDIAPGCLCIPHGWAKANVNALVDVEAIDALAGTAVLSGLAVDLTTAR